MRVVKVYLKGTRMDLDRIRDTLIAQRGRWKDIADRAGVSMSWLSKFANKHIASPRVATAERLDRALNDRTVS